MPPVRSCTSEPGIQLHVFSGHAENFPDLEQPYMSKANISEIESEGVRDRKWNPTVEVVE